MIKDLDINPRKWNKADVERVRQYCNEQGGGAVLFPQQEDNESETFAKLLPDGILLVWFTHAEVRHEWRFEP